jgi:hypothetical protein
MTQSITNGIIPPTGGRAFLEPDEIVRCRSSLGLSRDAFAMALRMEDDCQKVAAWEEGTLYVTGPESLAIEYLMYLHAIDEPLIEHWSNYAHKVDFAA